jgi:hypothetical protein
LGGFTDPAIFLLGGGALAGSDGNDLALSAGRVISGDFSGGAEAKKSTSQSMAIAKGITGVPSVGDNSPIEAFDSVINYNPASSGGAAVTWPELRAHDLDIEVSSGSATNVYGITARSRIRAAGSVGTYTGYYSQPFNGNLATDSEGSITTYIAFHAGLSPLIIAPISGTIGDYTGLLLDDVDANYTVSGDRVAIDIPHVDFPIRMGETVKQSISVANANTGSLQINGAFAQGGAFDAGSSIDLTALVTPVVSGAFYSNPAISMFTTHAGSNSSGMSIIGVVVNSIISGTQASALERTGLVVTTSSDSNASNNVFGMVVNNLDTTTPKYNYGISIQGVRNSTTTSAAIGISGSNVANCIAFDAQDSASTSDASAKIYWNGTNLVVWTAAGGEENISSNP